jgi:hypothetical protein
LPPTRSALWSWRDPVPAIWDIASAVAGLARDLCESVARYARRREAVVVVRKHSATVL